MTASGAWAWAKRAPAERLTLPACAGVWTAAEIMHAAAVPGMDIALPAFAVAGLAYGRVGGKAKDKTRGRRHARHVFTGIATVGGWLAVASAASPLGGPDHALTWTWAAGSLGGYLWLRRHEVVVAARDWRNAKSEWLESCHRWGLGGSHLLHHEYTRLGELMIADVTGTRKRASQIAHGDLAERIAEERGLPVSRVQVKPHRIAGRVEISIRERNPWANPITHPVLCEDPEIDLSGPCTVRRPLIVGQDPETGTPLTMALWDEDGGKRIMVTAITRGGKTVLLNCIRERVTAADDGLLLDINLSKALEDKEWAPACHLTAITKAQAGRALKILRLLCAVIEWRSQQPRQDAVFQPSPGDPLLVAIVDEIDTLAAIPAAKPLLKYVYSKGGSEGVAVVSAGQRGLAEWVGGGDVRSQADVFAISQVSRRGEMMHAAGDLGLMMPDMASYGEGHKGVWVIAELGGEQQIGRTFNLKEPADIRELAAERAFSQPDLPPALRTFLGDSYENLLSTDVFAWWARQQDGTRPPAVAHPRPDAPADTRPSPVAVIAGENQLAELDSEAEAAVDPDLAARWRATGEKIAGAQRLLAETGETGPPDIPREDLIAHAEREWRKLGAATDIPETAREPMFALLKTGTTISAIADALGVTRWVARTYLERLRGEGLVAMEGRGRGARWVMAVPPQREDGDAT